MRTRSRPKRRRPASKRDRERGSDAEGKRMLASVRELCSFEARLAGTDAERRAAEHLADSLRERGRSAEIEPSYVHPQSPLVHALHCALGFAGSLIAVKIPALGFGLVLLAATSMYFDLNTRFYLLRRLFFRRVSQTVVSPGKNPTADARILVVAHYDAARMGAIFTPRWVGRYERISRLLPLPLGPYRAIFWSLALLLPLLGARMAGVDSGALALIQLVPTLTLLVGLFFCTDVELSEVAPGANDNASGVAVALELANRLEADAPKATDVWIVFTGAKECLAEGFRSYLRSHRKRWRRTPTAVVNLDCVGRGELRYVTSQGAAVGFDMDKRLGELCEALAGAESAEEPRARPLRTPHADDALAARIAGLRAITLTALDRGSFQVPDQHTESDLADRVDRGSLERTLEFATELLAGIDRDAARAAARD